MFDTQKKHVLKKYEDAKKKGLVDKDIIQLLDLINSFEDYYTTSSCSGRINILKVPISRKKNESEWLFKSHSCIDYKNIQFILNKDFEDSIKDFRGWIYFKAEGLIFHIVSRDLKSAQKLLDIANEVGLKRTGIRGLRRRIVVEIDDVECISAPIYKDSTLLINEDYLKSLVELANESLKRVKNKRDKLFEVFMSLKNSI